MNATEASKAMMMVPMRERTVALLMARRLWADEPLDHVAERLARDLATPAPLRRAKLDSNRTFPVGIARAKHSAVVFGMTVSASSLGKLFAEIVDAVHSLDASVIERLAIYRARKRRFVARSQFDVHQGRMDLQVIQARTGWWVSANVSEADVRRGVKALCDVASLSFGEDIVFPAQEGVASRSPFYAAFAATCGTSPATVVR
jgi:hypothetical protein